MLTGEHYHRSITASDRDRRSRDRFVRLALSLLPPRQRVLDFGAGTGIDAKTYAAAGHIALVHEPAAEQSAYLADLCRAEIARGAIVPSAFPPPEKVKAITANFAVLNLVSDLDALFASFSRVIDDDGFVLVSLLNPFYLRDVRYRWWSANLPELLRRGWYAVGGSGGSRRYAPRAVVRSAAPHFRLERMLPGRPGLPVRQYFILLFRHA